MEPLAHPARQEVVVRVVAVPVVINREPKQERRVRLTRAAAVAALAMIMVQDKMQTAAQAAPAS